MVISFRLRRSVAGGSSTTIYAVRDAARANRHSSKQVRSFRMDWSIPGSMVRASSQRMDDGWTWSCSKETVFGQASRHGEEDVPGATARDTEETAGRPHRDRFEAPQHRS